ncbi:MAG: alpha/beta fold hydrolase [Chlamydiales bacterium]
MMDTELWAIAGFLGLPSDWSCFGLEQCRAFAPEDFDSAQLPFLGLMDWAEHFNLHFQAQGKKPGVLMGYSLGGRLALHTLIQNPSLWRAAIIISAHPGLVAESERLARQQLDNDWAARFEKEDWASLMFSWNQRSTFSCGHFQFERQEKDYCRQRLAASLRGWSLGVQRDLRQELSQLDLPIYWMVGERDETYCKLMQEVELNHPLSKKIILPQAGHRAPWEQPAQFRLFCHELLFQTNFTLENQ